MSTIVSHSPLNISKTVNRSLVSKDHQLEMAYVESNGHAIDDVTWTLKDQGVIPIRLKPNISKTAGDAI